VRPDALRYDMALAGLIVRLIRNRSLNPLWMQALRVILSRARVDPAYADITGGVLAGMEPASSVIQPRVLGGTVQQAAMSLGVGVVKHALRGPRHLVHVGRQTASSSMLVVSETALHPVEYAQWGAGVVAGAAELAGQMVRHLGEGVRCTGSRPVLGGAVPQSSARLLRCGFPCAERAQRLRCADLDRQLMRLPREVVFRLAALDKTSPHP
jgi:DNA-binding transcriptional regulator YdaS (Cro superfamily)